jgi:hypothetical protein
MKGRFAASGGETFLGRVLGSVTPDLPSPQALTKKEIKRAFAEV